MSETTPATESAPETAEVSEPEGEVDEFTEQLERLDAEVERQRGMVDEIRERAEAAEERAEAAEKELAELKAAQAAEAPSAQPDTADTSPAAGSGDAGPSEDDSDEPRRGRVRERLANAEHAVSDLTDQLAAQRAAVFADAVQRGGIDTVLAAAAGLTVDQFIDPESGLIDTDAITAVADQIRAAYGIARRPRPVSGVGQGYHEVQKPATWESYMQKIAMRLPK